MSRVDVEKLLVNGAMSSMAAIGQSPREQTKGRQHGARAVGTGAGRLGGAGTRWRYCGEVRESAWAVAARRPGRSCIEDPKRPVRRCEVRVFGTPTACFERWKFGLWVRACLLLLRAGWLLVDVEAGGRRLTWPCTGD